MLTKEENERLTRVGPGTPGGELLRRYWQPLCATEQLHERGRARVRLLGQDLVVFKRPDGSYACVPEQCPHRNASLYLGFSEPDGLRCCYHGWKFDWTSGACLERPFETVPPHAGLRIPIYPVEELGGLLFGYLGPDPDRRPLLPRWDVLVRDDQERVIVTLPIHYCNWLQIQENTADSVHTYYLHGESSAAGPMEVPGAAYYHRPIARYDYEVCEWGIEKILEYGGDRPELEVRPPLIFPNILRIPQGPVEAIHWRVPIDDEQTRIIWAGLVPDPKFLPNTTPGARLSGEPITFTDLSETTRVPLERENLGDFFTQDRVVLETQGAIANRARETLGASDRGIVLFRRMLSEQIALVERGEDPTVAVVRDPDRNRIIAFENATQPTLP